MIVVDQPEIDIRAPGRPPLDHRRIHRFVPPALEDEHRLRHRKRQRVVARRVFVEGESDVARFVERVVEKPEPAEPAPFVDAVLAELPQTVAAEIQRRRQQDQM